MRYSDDIIEEVRQKNDIVDVVSQYVKLTRKGSSYFGLCPFHNEKTPFFFLYISSKRPRKSIAFPRAFCYNTFHREHLLLTQGHLTNQRKKAMP